MFRGRGVKQIFIRFGVKRAAESGRTGHAYPIRERAFVTGGRRREGGEVGILVVIYIREEKNIIFTVVTDWPTREIGLTVARGSTWAIDEGWGEGAKVIFHLGPFYGRPKLNRYFGTLNRAPKPPPSDDATGRKTR